MNSEFDMESGISDISNPTRHPVVTVDEENVRAHYGRIRDHYNTLESVIKNERCKEGVSCKIYLIADQSLSGEFFLIHRYIAHDWLEGDASLRRTYEKRNKKYVVLPYKTVGFEGYKHDTNADSDRTLKYMDSLGDSALFIGLNGGSVLSAKDYPGLNPNSIYFTDDLNHGSNYGSSANGAYLWIEDYENINFGGHDIGIYNYSDRGIKKCYYPISVQRYKKIQPSPVWFSPNYI